MRGLHEMPAFNVQMGNPKKQIYVALPQFPDARNNEERSNAMVTPDVITGLRWAMVQLFVLPLLMLAVPMLGSKYNLDINVQAIFIITVLYCVVDVVVGGMHQTVSIMYKNFKPESSNNTATDEWKVQGALFVLGFLIQFFAILLLSPMGSYEAFNNVYRFEHDGRSENADKNPHNWRNDVRVQVGVLLLINFVGSVICKSYMYLPYYSPEPSTWAVNVRRFFKSTGNVIALWQYLLYTVLLFVIIAQNNKAYKENYLYSGNDEAYFKDANYLTYFKDKYAVFLWVGDWKKVST